MQTIEFATDVVFGEVKITEIKVAPITFLEFYAVWKGVTVDEPKPEVATQRARIRHQVHFMAGKDRYVPNEIELGSLPFEVAREIEPLLYDGQGALGKKVGTGDGVLKPALYELGTPFTFKPQGKDVVTVSELEFLGTSYAELEDFLAADNDLSKTIALVRMLANPVGVESLTRLPESYVEKITLSDGLGIMRTIVPGFTKRPTDT